MGCRTCVGACAVLAICRILWASAPQAHVGLSIEQRRSVPASILRGAVAEAARVWASYDVLVDDDVPHACDGRSFLIVAVLDGEHPAEEGENGFASIHFAPDGSADPRITIHYDTIAGVAARATVMGADPSALPTRVRDDAIARAVGRALAHEIGHYLLRWPHHASAGLMRAEHHVSALTDPDLKPFVLSPNDIARLNLALRAPRPAVAELEDASRTRAICAAASGR